mgnify:CR=1 FL=1
MRGAAHVKNVFSNGGRDTLLLGGCGPGGGDVDCTGGGKGTCECGGEEADGDGRCDGGKSASIGGADQGGDGGRGGGCDTTWALLWVFSLIKTV